MPRYRNPRYAPEFLERRLHPDASVTNLASVAIVSGSTLQTNDPTTTGELPPLPTPPPPPTGPTGPAVTSTFSTTASVS